MFSLQTDGHWTSILCHLFIDKNKSIIFSIGRKLFVVVSVKQFFLTSSYAGTRVVRYVAAESPESIHLFLSEKFLKHVS